MAKSRQPTLFDFVEDEPHKPAPIAKPVVTPPVMPAAPTSVRVVKQPDTFGPDPATILPEGFVLNPDERVRFCPQCHKQGVMQHQRANANHPAGWTTISHYVRGRVGRAIVADLHHIFEELMA